jgi:uncharacterized protein
MPVIDFHTHAFADGIAHRAISRIQGLADAAAVLDGRLSSLLSSMDAAGIERGVVLSIATKPKQFEPILEWSRTVASDRIIPFASVSPADPQAAEHVRVAAEEGIAGLKFHPYYQDFDLDGPCMDPVYGTMEERGLICVMHTGFDHAFSFTRRADPERILRVLARFPRLAFVATHLGAWKDWDEVARLLPGAACQSSTAAQHGNAAAGRAGSAAAGSSAPSPRAGLWIDTAYSLEFLSPGAARGLIASFPVDRLLFGSDSPWSGQDLSLSLVRRLGLEASTEEAILGGNARRLLGLKA